MDGASVAGRGAGPGPAARHAVMPFIRQHSPQVRARRAAAMLSLPGDGAAGSCSGGACMGRPERSCSGAAGEVRHGPRNALDHSSRRAAWVAPAIACCAHAALMPHSCCGHAVPAVLRCVAGGAGPAARAGRLHQLVAGGGGLSRIPGHGWVGVQRAGRAEGRGRASSPLSVSGSLQPPAALRHVSGHAPAAPPHAGSAPGVRTSPTFAACAALQPWAPRAAPTWQHILMTLAYRPSWRPRWVGVGAEGGAERQGAGGCASIQQSATQLRPGWGGVPAGPTWGSWRARGALQLQ